MTVKKYLTLFLLFISDEMFNANLDKGRKVNGIISAHGRFKQYKNIDRLRCSKWSQGAQTDISYPSELVPEDSDYLGIIFHYVIISLSNMFKHNRIQRLVIIF